MKTQYHLTAMIWREGKSYVSKCPELGVASFGSTPHKAQEALHEAVALYLSNAKKLGFLDEFSGALHSTERYTSALDIAA